MNKTFVGTSGWNYKHWRDNVFYPDGLPQNKWLEYYAGFFSTVELNVTFYRLPSKETFKHWHEITPKKFCFVAKGSRFITHIKRLNDIKDPLRLFLKNVSGLKEKLSCLLWQFAPSFPKKIDRLENFLKLLQKTKLRQTFEFRHPSWFDDETYSLLRKYKACLCTADSFRRKTIRELTTNFIYLRFHDTVTGNYSQQQLREWADFAQSCRPRDIFAFFNNDARGYAVKNALTFKRMLENYTS